MTAAELQRIAAVLSNSSCWVRHWLHWNYPVRSPVEMAINARDEDGKSVPVPDLERAGARREERRGHIFYVFTRRNDDGTLFQSQL